MKLHFPRTNSRLQLLLTQRTRKAPFYGPDTESAAQGPSSLRQLELLRAGLATSTQ